jgi:hypothetical protein
MVHGTLVILLTAIAWVVLGSILFFNPLVDRVYQKVYRHPENYPAVRVVPKSPSSLALILGINILKCGCYAAVYLLVVKCLPAEPVRRGVLFGVMLTLTRMIPGDVDRAFFSTYPAMLASIEFVIFTIGVFVIAMSYAFFL